jgi:hypothetical protein
VSAPSSPLRRATPFIGLVVRLGPFALYGPTKRALDSGRPDVLQQAVTILRGEARIYGVPRPVDTMYREGGRVFGSFAPFRRISRPSQSR